MAQKALLVGINKYPGCPLQGCVNDVEDVAALITEKCGFRMDDVRLLVDDRATTQAMLDRLQWIIDDAADGDRLLFWYSGHGTQLARRSLGGKIDSLSDAICPVDFDWSPEHAITDEDFADIFQPLVAKVTCEVVADACHSGNLFRDLCRGKPRQFPMPADIAWRNRTASHEGIEARGFARAIEHLNGAYISGCRSDQTSADACFDNRYNGALSYYLLETLHGPYGLTTPVGEIVPKVVTALKSNGYDQEPQIRGNPAAINKPWLG